MPEQTARVEFRYQIFLLFQQTQYQFWRYFQLSNSTQACAHIFYAGTKQIHIVVDKQKSIVVLLWQLYKHYFAILSVVLLQVDQERLVVATVDSSLNPIRAFIQESKHMVIYIVINQHNTLLSASHQFRHVSPRIPYTACGKYLFRLLLW